MCDEDIFDNVVMLEHSTQQAGYSEGLMKGKEEGKTEGYILGWEKGASLGSETGFYLGYSEELLQHVDKDPKKQRVCKVLKSIIDLAGKLNYTDPTDQKLFDEIERIRGKFKQATSLLGISTASSTTPSQKGGMSF